MISMSEEKSLLFDVFMTRMRVKGNEFVSTSEFESDVQSAVDVIAEEVHILRAQLAEAREALEYLSQKDNYLTIQTGIITGGGHASDFANFALRKIDKVTTA